MTSTVEEIEIYAQERIDQLVSEQVVNSLCNGEIELPEGQKLMKIEDDSQVNGALCRQLIQIAFDSGVGYGRNEFKQEGKE